MTLISCDEHLIYVLLKVVSEMSLSIFAVNSLDYENADIGLVKIRELRVIRREKKGV